jgi:hypothetical protein
MPTARSREDQVFVRDGRRHHRARYSWNELRAGAGMLLLLAAILAWVAWRGAHPDPSLLATSTLPDDASTPPAADRGPLPAGLAAAGWSEGPASTFGPENLYVKIDGREDYYKSLGFRRLWCVTLTSVAASPSVVDVEAYDLGEAANALGAFAGERPADAAVDVRADGLAAFHRNALYVVRGALYVRAIGSDETPALRAELEHLRARLEAELPGAPLPQGWALFVARLGLDPGAVSYTAENAFSFGFAKDVWSARLADETELFVIAAGDDAAADSLAGRFCRGFSEYGDAAGNSRSVRWVQDRYIRTVSGAKALGPWTIGVRGAPDRAAAEAALSKLEPAVRSLPLESRP